MDGEAGILPIKSQLKGEIPETNVPQTYQPADESTFDFGETYVRLGGQETKVHLAVCAWLTRAPILFLSCPQALFECHLMSFA